MLCCFVEQNAVQIVWLTQICLICVCGAECCIDHVACTDLSDMCGCVPAAPASGRGEEGSLYEAESWAAIGAFLFGPDPSKALTSHPGSGQGTKSGIKV